MGLKRKQILITVSLLVVFYLILTSLTTVNPPRINNYIPVSIYAKKVYSGNGLSIDVYPKKFLLNWSLKTSNSWETCSDLHPALDYSLKIAGLKKSLNTRFKYTVDVEDDRYRAFLESDFDIISIHGFADYGGANPSKDESAVCDQSVHSQE